MDKVTTEILERLCNGDSRSQIAREMDIPESWVQEAIDEYNREARSQPQMDMFGNVVDKWATPVGLHRIARKYISLQMSGGTTGAGYDLPGIGWTSIFATGGVAIHSTFWHNSFGIPQSHGCVNCKPDDARWVFRWTAPTVSAEPGDITVAGQKSTQVLIRET